MPQNIVNLFIHTISQKLTDGAPALMNDLTSVVLEVRIVLSF